MWHLIEQLGHSPNTDSLWYFIDLIVEPALLDCLSPSTCYQCDAGAIRVVVEAKGNDSVGSH